MQNASPVYNALKEYHLYLQIDAPYLEQLMFSAVSKCKEYIENGGDLNKEWLFSNSTVINSAAKYYHRFIDKEIKEAKENGEEALLSYFRSERDKIMKLEYLLDKSYFLQNS